MTPVERYFSAEKMWCIGGALIALASIGIACWFLFRVKQPFQNGVAWPFLGLGILFFIICISVALRSTGDVARVTAMVNGNLNGLTNDEVPRMAGVMRTFTIIISVEIALVVTSVALLLFANLSPIMKGIMTALLIQATWLLTFDLFARQRGAEYFKYLNGLIK